MAKDPLNEMLEFLQPNSRLDLKHVSLDYLLGLSGKDDGLNTLLENEQIVQCIIELIADKIDDISKIALSLLVNITAQPKGALELLKYKANDYKNIVELLIGYVRNPDKRYADIACMILTNITRSEEGLEICLDTFIPHLNDLLNVFVNLDYNKKKSNLHYLSPMFSNLSQSIRIRKWLLEENPHVPLIKLLPFCNFEHSNIRRGGAIGTVRNLSFDTENHDYLLSSELDLLTYLLHPLMGDEDYEDEEMDKLPIALQYLPKEKKRDPDVDVRKMILETLVKFCTKRKGREVLRENGVYYILREYHKWERDAHALLACENVVDILIQKEDEVGAEDLSTVDVPDDMKEQFDKMDQEYLNTVK
ncbi:protein HGH1 homolog [Plodia interpunctella]|uniref:protein HGH1 homolog n=1 Tax=Plodia interpunctella TaxID=58824 RepID=UPI002367749A|nr:protein HGH1 homolog [Plodia interpunctella]